ncbi:MAG: ABC transporter ATP-binding protein [Spirochaetaceae bacterium]|jgi:NitT/TauT family transport system ATP-binding protein|nr:ABC transporter ATP-binding protein [Spirochaetaceae bacterium]
MLRLENITFGFGERPVFTNFSLTFGEAQNPLVILGPSGCGKTTLLRLMAGLLKPWAGRVIPPSAPGLSGSAFVFQEPRLIPWLTVRENVLLPLKRVMSRQDAEERSARFLESLGLAEKSAVYPDALSGGQRQRVSMARAFAYPSRVLFMDEPFQSLDIPLRIELMEMTLNLIGEEPRFLVAVTHDPREAVFLGRRILVLGLPGGRIVLDEQVSRERPAGPYVFGDASRNLESRVMQACIEALPG